MVEQVASAALVARVETVAQLDRQEIQATQAIMAPEATEAQPATLELQVIRVRMVLAELEVTEAPRVI